MSLEAITNEILWITLGLSVINFCKKDKNAWLLDVAFTAQMEENLDEICNGDKQYLAYMKEIHSKMDFTPLKAEPKEKKGYPPSPKQIQFCEDIAKTLSIDLPNGYKQDYKIASKFISDNSKKMPKIDY